MNVDILRVGALTCLLLSATCNVRAENTTSLHRDSAEVSLVRGTTVFKTYCTGCHGVHGEGDGIAARTYNPPPANLVLSQHNDEYKELIIRRGGQALGRSRFMPPWGEQLTDAEINDLITYLHSIKRP